jgi:hypothetical protein
MIPMDTAQVLFLAAELRQITDQDNILVGHL